MNNSTNEIRQTFLNFFYKKGHKIIPGSSLIPKNDQTLLFTNAGMNQFKNIFLGLEKKTYSRIATSQYCIRAGGKHNDLENVGYTTRHHTFFEMLGNFSFGDYFKKEAIHFAWELLTSKKWFNLPKEKILITIYFNDDESYHICNKEIDIPKNHIIRIGDKKGKSYISDNFWQMSETGPCGPCMEFFYDYGKDFYGEPPGSNKSNGDRYIEIWNLVFMQFNKKLNGKLESLPQISIDTGMGLERISSILQNVKSNYEIDIFQKLISTISILTKETNLKNKSLYVIADHIRACVFLIAEGVIPSNEGKGYVLRRIIRRAIRHGYILGTKNPFFYKLVQPVLKIMEITNNFQNKQIMIEKILKNEEEQFSRTLERGLNLLNTELNTLKTNILEGEIAFRLYDTYGFPLDLTIDICREHKIEVDKKGFKNEMEKQRNKAKKIIFLNKNQESQIKIDINYKNLDFTKNKQQANIIKIYKNNKPVTSLQKNEDGVIILNKTPFYASSGGQIGDTGILKNNNGNFIVTKTEKYNQSTLHFGKIDSGVLSINNTITAEINEKKRKSTSLNHSATHLLHATLRKILGKHVFQKGSSINDKTLRFDFLHFKALTKEEIQKIEKIINKKISENLLIKTKLTSLEDAKNKGAIALFNHKYKEHVRVVSINNFSIELCGGTHAKQTGDLRIFKILNEHSVSSGIRRIEATTGETAIENINDQLKQLLIIENILKTDKTNIIKKIKSLIEKSQQLKNITLKLKKEEYLQKSILLCKKSKNIKGINILITQLDCIDINTLKILVDNIKIQLKSAIIILSTINNNKINIIAGITNELSNKIKANELIYHITKEIDGKGGGNSKIAQAGGTNLNALPTALKNIEKLIDSKL
ncbi:alanine--tRNA ligase [Candidatus Providencia siddallii]|uniref:Alanine--tRNA ligase n=1 Tax=Candidatus Providencia siddallii TaxID=1715285 RepID=A0ABP1CE98_9GAMM